MAVIDPADSISDILLPDVLDLQDQVDSGTGSAAEYGGLYTNGNSHWHSGGWTYGTQTYHRRSDNGVTAVIMMNYNNDDVGGADSDALIDIMNKDITYPCYNQATYSATGVSTAYKNTRVTLDPAKVAASHISVPKNGEDYDVCIEDSCVNGATATVVIFPEGKRN
eukprot:262761_1